MDHEFDYMNIPQQEQPQPEQPQQPQQPEQPQQPQQAPYYYNAPYQYTYPPQPEQPAPQPAPQPEKQPAPKKRKRKSGKALVIVISIVAAVLILLNISMIVTNANLKQALQSQINRNDALDERVDELEKAMEGGVKVPSNPGQAPTPEGLYTPQQVYSMNVDAVVAVMSQIMQKNNYGEITKATSAGSGFLISSDGYVITNYHVIEGGSKITVITYDEKEHNATVVGYDKTNDVALLKIEGENFACVTIGSSDELQVGDQVMAIGNPLGELTSTLTVGYVSAKDRMVTTDGSTINMLQTDAAINSGNSGGPLFNAKGEVVGINTAKYSGTSSSGATIEGIGFAIPIDDVAGIIGDLQDKGYVSSTYLGVYVSEVDAAAQQNYGIPAGASVLEVTPGYCAEKAGIQAKDIIIAVGEYKVDSLSALSRALRRFEPGDTTTVTVWRAGVELELEITLDEKPQEIPESSQPQDQEQEQQPSQEPPAQEEEDGFSFEDFLDRFFGFG